MAAAPQKVLIVEDDLLLQIVEERLVSKLGYNVIGTAAEGEQALRNIATQSPDILLIDINLKGSLNGIEIANRLNKEGFDIPIIFLTGDNTHKLSRNVNNKECIDFLIKPVTVSSLKESLEKAVEYNKHSAQTAA